MRELTSRREISMLESRKDELMLAGCNQWHDLRMLSIQIGVWCVGNGSFSLDGNFDEMRKLLRFRSFGSST